MWPVGLLDGLEWPAVGLVGFRRFFVSFSLS